MKLVQIVNAALLSGCLMVGMLGMPASAHASGGSGGDGGGGDILVFDILGVADDSSRAVVEEVAADRPHVEQASHFDGRLLSARDLATEQ